MERPTGNIAFFNYVTLHVRSSLPDVTTSGLTVAACQDIEPKAVAVPFKKTST